MLPRLATSGQSRNAGLLPVLLSAKEAHLEENGRTMSSRLQSRCKYSIISLVLCSKCAHFVNGAETLNSSVMVISHRLVEDVALCFCGAADIRAR